LVLAELEARETASLHDEVELILEPVGVQLQHVQGQPDEGRRASVTAVMATPLVAFNFFTGQAPDGQLVC
jgi:hypothetical protein